MKTLSDRDLGIDCEFIASGETDEEVLNNSTDHLRDMHPEEYKMVKGSAMSDAIKDNGSETGGDLEKG